MWPVVVVVVDVPIQDAFEVSTVDDEDAVEALAPEGAGKTLRDGVRLGRRHRRAEDPDVLAAEDLVERGRELRVAVADQNRIGASRSSVSASMMLRACWVVQAPVGLAVTPAT